MEQMGGEAAVLREILPLLEDLQHPVPNIPAPPMDRLRSEVGAVFESREKSKAELGDLLSRLEKWARQQAGASREEVKAMVNVLRSSLLGEGSEELMADVRMLSASKFAPAAPRLLEEAESYALADESKRRQEELEDRLRSIDKRLQQAEDISSECRKELHQVLELIGREKESSGKRGGQHSDLIKKPKS
jgi:plasmid stabilization system protein ParE